MTNVETILTLDLQIAIEQLGKALQQAEPLQAYRRAQAVLAGDAEATELLTKYSAAQRTLRMQQSRNVVTQESIDQLRELDRQVRANPTIMAYAEAQQTANAYLAQINLEISELLGMNFGAWASSGSC
ncbi:MAG: hypothetical protein Kow0077_15690 [Anaerolineae bacterium]